MTNDSTKFHVDIEDFSRVDSTSAPTVRRASWNPSLGYAREQAIEEARTQAMEDHLKAKAEQNAVFTTERFMMMEGAIKNLQDRVKELESK